MHDEQLSKPDQPIRKGISVLVCTFNGSKRLPRTIEHLAQQSVRTDVKWEIIVVDNASTDDTIDVVNKEWAKFQPVNTSLSVISEPKAGRVYALATGARSCKYEYLISCDDDNWLSRDYVQKTYDLLESDHRIGAVGGQSFAVSSSGILPDWFDAYKEGYAVGQQGEASGDVTSRGYLFGAGLGTRTKLYRDIYANFPSLLVGRQGEKLSSGEDSEYCQRLILKGYTLVYDNHLTFKHYIPEERLQTAYRDSLFAGFKEADQILFDYYFTNKLRQKLANNISSKIRLLIISPLRLLFAKSEAKRRAQLRILRYLLNLKSDDDPVFDAIRQFERMESN
ncbi:glycosyltransferase [Arcticibacter sp.]|uniref:glycosyltransferase n=1 Tax=Arcticibacter sp. TaxID=1872630 RepID=UPI00388D75C2